MKHVVVLLLLFIAVSTCAQQRQGKEFLDSLLSELPKAGRDTPAVKLLNEIAFSTYLSNPDKGAQYAEQAQALAHEIGWKKGEALGLNSRGNSARQKAAYAQALEFYFDALHIYEELDSRNNVAIVANNIGTVYYYQKEYAKALEYYSKSLNMAQGDKEKEQLACGNIGNVYFSQGKHALALTYMQRALGIAQALGDREGLMTQLSNIGNVYGSMGNNDTALICYFRALAIAKEAHDTQLIAANEGNIGETYLDIAKAASSPPAARAHHLSVAISYMRQGIIDARTVGFSSAVLDFSQALSEACAMKGDYKGALDAYRQYTALKDSTFSIENNEKMEHLETARALQLKDKDILIAKLAVEKKRNERYAYIGGIVLLLIITGILARSFRRQRHSNVLLSKEKRRSDALLLNILPEEVAEELKDSGSSLARQYNDVTVLFTDFVDFTGIAQQLSPQGLVQELHECFTAFDTIIERNGLEKIKTIGDAYMAVCGMPQSDERHAQRSVRAALEIRDFVAARKAAANVSIHRFEIRIGINSGPVVAGIVGVKKFAYDIWGDTVNTAARMEQCSEPGYINISHSTYELVKNDYRCNYRGKIAAKHKGEVEMYFVMSDE